MYNDKSKRNEARRKPRGFTLVEVLVSLGLLAVGIVSVLGAYGSMAKSESKRRLNEVMQRLAERKYEEILVTSQNLSSPSSGDFTDWNENRFTWSYTVDTTGADNLSAITLTVTPSNQSKPSAVVTGLVYIPPLTTTTTGATTP